jgi:hypothetical protein
MNNLKNTLARIMLSLALALGFSAVMVAPARAAVVCNSKAVTNLDIRTKTVNWSDGVVAKYRIKLYYGYCPNDSNKKVALETLTVTLVSATDASGNPITASTVASTFSGQSTTTSATTLSGDVADDTVCSVYRDFTPFGWIKLSDGPGYSVSITHPYGSGGGFGESFSTYSVVPADDGLAPNIRPVPC